MDPLYYPIQQTLHRLGHAAGDAILVGLSGGPDSLALTHALFAMNLPVEAGHVHHGLRPSADRELDLLSRWCAERGIPFQSERIDVAAIRQERALSPEEAARNGRYQALARMAAKRGIGAIALGHHADDQLETMLLRLTKGCALEGFRGIPSARSMGPLRILRPLIGISRADILSYIDRHGLCPIDDETNRDEAIPRNLLRERVVPVLKQLNPQVLSTLNTNQALWEEDLNWIASLTEEAFGSLGPVVLPQLCHWDESAFRALAPSLQRRILLKGFAMVRGDRRGITSNHLEGLRHHLLEGRGSRDVFRGLRAIAQYGRIALWLSAPETPPVPFEEGTTKAFGREFSVGRTGEVCFDRAKLPADLVWRRARPTDRFRPWGREHERPLGHFSRGSVCFYQCESARSCSHRERGSSGW